MNIKCLNVTQVPTIAKNFFFQSSHFCTYFHNSCRDYHIIFFQGHAHYNETIQHSIDETSRFSNKYYTIFHVRFPDDEYNKYPSDSKRVQETLSPRRKFWYDGYFFISHNKRHWVWPFYSGPSTWHGTILLMAVSSHKGHKRGNNVPKRAGVKKLNSSWFISIMVVVRNIMNKEFVFIRIFQKQYTTFNFKDDPLFHTK